MANNAIKSHYENLMRVRAHAAITYYKNSKSIYRKIDIPKLESRAALCHTLLSQGAEGAILRRAADSLFEVITFALGRARGSTERDNMAHESS